MTPPVHRFVRYSGRSMWPCFQEGDLLEIETVAEEVVRVGDCVLLRSHNGTCFVHRVVGFQGILCTRGDAMAQIDNHLAGEPELLGRVHNRYRMGKISRVANGGIGRLAGRFHYYAGRIDPEQKGLGGNLARGIRWLCAPFVQPVIRRGSSRFLSLPGREILVVWGIGKKVVAQQQSVGGTWQVRWPWRIVVPPPDRCL